MVKFDIIDAIVALNPTAQVNVHGEEIEWVDGNPTDITREQIDAKIIELETDYNNKEYQRNRVKEYPAIGDQLDMLWHSINEDAALKSKYFKFHQAILAVKSKYSK